MPLHRLSDGGSNLIVTLLGRSFTASFSQVPNVGAKAIAPSVKPATNISSRPAPAARRSPPLSLTSTHTNTPDPTATLLLIL